MYKKIFHQTKSVKKTILIGENREGNGKVRCSTVRSRK